MDVNNKLEIKFGRKGLLWATFGFIKGIFCYETAAFLNDMCRFGDEILYLFSPDIEEESDLDLIVYCPTEYGVLDYSECTERAEGVYVTDPLRTIRDLVRRNAYYEQVCECLDWWNREYSSLGLVVVDLESEGLGDKLQEYLDKMPAYGFKYKLFEND